MPRRPRCAAPARPSPAQGRLPASPSRASASPDAGALDEALESERLHAAEELLSRTLQKVVAQYRAPVFTFAGLASDCFLLHHLHAGGHLAAGCRHPVSVVFIDTLHLFPETTALLRTLEAAYSFTAHVYTPLNAPTKAAWNKLYSSDLYMTEPERYDALAKVEPLQRALSDLQADCWITGRRRDQGAERRALALVEAAPAAGAGLPAGPVKANPLAHWSFQDVFTALDLHGVARHPLHAEGYPSLGDVHSTLPVEPAKWFHYGGERAGRFQGLLNKDGTPKSECGIHVAGAGGAASALPQSSSLLRPQ